jgi:hypothetical protein
VSDDADKTQYGGIVESVDDALNPETPSGPASADQTEEDRARAQQQADEFARQWEGERARNEAHDVTDDDPPPRTGPYPAGARVRASGRFRSVRVARTRERGTAANWSLRRAISDTYSPTSLAEALRRGTSVAA